MQTFSSGSARGDFRLPRCDQFRKRKCGCGNPRMRSSTGKRCSDPLRAPSLHRLLAPFLSAVLENWRKVVCEHKHSCPRKHSTHGQESPLLVATRQFHPLQSNLDREYSLSRQHSTPPDQAPPPVEAARKNTSYSRKQQPCNAPNENWNIRTWIRRTDIGSLSVAARL